MESDTFVKTVFMETEKLVPSKGKNAKEYLLEGLMVFIAVSLGFFAEQLRQSIVDKQHEREYMQSMIDDLEVDMKRMPIPIKGYSNRNKDAADSLPILLKNAKLDTPANEIYFHFRGLIRYVTFKVFITDRTIAQLKNTGELRLISNKMVSDSILYYYRNIEYLQSLEQYLFLEKNALRERLSTILDGEMYDKVINDRDQIIRPTEPLYLRALQPDEVNDCILRISDIKGLSNNMLLQIKNLHAQAQRLRDLIKQEYAL